MTSEIQQEANRRNAQKSTGPRTDEGRSVSKLNAIKHGLTAEAVVIKGEDPKAFEQLQDDMIREFAPETTFGFQLVDRIASLLWRLKRVPVIEASMMEAHRLEVEFEDERKSSLDISFAVSTDEIAAQNKLKGRDTSLGRAFIQGARKLDTIGKLSRYESSLVGMLNTMLRQLDQERSRRDHSDPGGELVELKPIKQCE